MKILFILLFFIQSSFVIASEEVWKMGDKFIPFLRDDKNKTLVSKDCEDGKCQAVLVLKKVSLKKITADKLAGGKNPGAVVCHEVDDGKVIYLKDLQGNENTFCFYKDKSMVSASTLYIQAQKNDGDRK
jgi:aerobic-type carbon monoxide dehydrogenase small subunit (CoxS/CutS family)